MDESSTSKLLSKIPLSDEEHSSKSDSEVITIDNDISPKKKKKKNVSATTKSDSENSSEEINYSSDDVIEPEKKSKSSKKEKKPKASAQKKSPKKSDSKVFNEESDSETNNDLKLSDSEEIDEITETKHKKSKKSNPYSLFLSDIQFWDYMLGWFKLASNMLLFFNATVDKKNTNFVNNIKHNIQNKKITKFYLDLGKFMDAAGISRGGTGKQQKRASGQPINFPSGKH